MFAESIRKTWEINACDVNLRNPQWAQWVQNSVLPMCAEQLGLLLETRPFIHAELYKLLLYEEGAHFKPHRDSEKAPGMFATLAICLPSQFEGGDLVLESGEKTRVEQLRTIFRRCVGSSVVRQPLCTHKCPAI